MARIRSIKPAFFKSVSVAELPSDACRLTWIGLWTYVDDAGRGVDDARLVKGEIWALHDKQTAKAIEGHLKALTDAGMVCRYETGGRRYLHVVSWARHQTINRPQPSVIPPCPTHDHAVNGHGSFTEHSVNGHGASSEPSRPEGKGRERKGKSSSSTINSHRHPDPPPDDDDDRGYAAIRTLASRDLERRILEKGPVGDPTSWLNAATERRYQRHHATLDQAPSDLTVEQLADWLDPPKSDQRRDYDGHAPIDCALCEGRGIIYDEEHDVARRCDHQPVPAQ